MKRAALLVLPLVLSSTACGPKPVAISVPPAERFQPVPEPTVPAGDSDAEVAGYLARLIEALRTANDRIAWLADWRAEVTSPDGR